MVEREVTRVTLFRHGAVQRMGERVVRGQLDVPLSQSGLAQHSAWERMLADTDAPGCIVSSDLERCKQLAQTLEDTSSGPLEISPLLREQDMGDWQGRTWSDISGQDGHAINDYWDDFVDARPPGGESFRELSERVVKWWGDFGARHAGESIWIVTHAGVIRALCAHWMGVDLGQALRFSPATASRTRFSITAAGAVLECFGEQPSGLTGIAPGRGVPGPLRIAFSGSAGTGKSTLARSVADELQLPYIEEGMRRRLESGLNLHDLTLEDLGKLVRDLWEEQQELEASHSSGFVADRSALDFAAFWLHYGLAENGPVTTDFLENMAKHTRRYSHVFVCPYGVLPLEDDGVRSTNRWVQYRYQLILEGLFDRELGASGWIRVLRSGDLEARKQSVIGMVTGR